MKIIRSLENPLIKKIASLHKKKYREQYQCYLVEGYKNVKDILESESAKMIVEQICLSEDQEHVLSATPFSDFAAQTVLVDEKIIKHLSDTKTSSGVLLIAKKINYSPDTLLPALKKIVILDGISDPGNAGTIIRTALAARFEAVVIVKGTVDIYNPKVVRSAMGAMTKMPFLFYNDGSQVVQSLKKFGFTILSADIRGDYHIYNLPSFPKAALIMGSEDKGVSISPEVIDHVVTIPMDPLAESLNVAVASGILMYSLNKDSFTIVK